MRALILAIAALVFLALVDLFAVEPCPGQVVISGVVESAAHEEADGYFNIGKLSIAVPPDGIAAMTLRQFKGQDVRLVLIVNEPRTRKEINR